MASPRLSSWEVAYKTNWVWCPGDSRQSSVCPFSRVLPYAKACPLSHSAPLACAVLCCALPSSLSPTQGKRSLAWWVFAPPVCLPPPVKVKAPIFSLVPVDFQCWEPHSPFHIPGMNENVERRFPRANFPEKGTFPEKCGKKKWERKRRRSEREDKKSAGRGAWNGEAGRRNLDSGAGAGGFWLG